MIPPEYEIKPVAIGRILVKIKASPIVAICIWINRETISVAVIERPALNNILPSLFEHLVQNC